jgi:predicted TIM-barrel fold metal-dependent hydrolase
MNTAFSILCVLFLLGNQFIRCNNDYYSMEDFDRVIKVDSHIHINTEDSSFIIQAIDDNFILLTINTDVPSYPPIEKQRALGIKHKKNYPLNVALATTFNLEGWGTPDWESNVKEYLQESFDYGALAVKVWKNIGMSFKDDQGQFVMIDHKSFDPIFVFLTKNNIPVVGHIGEPKNCWLPLEKMTVNNDKEYFSNHAEYHMYLHPEYPSYEALVKSRDNLLENHPDLKFIGCHLGSVEWSIEELGKRFDKYPNFAVDLAARMGHLQYQSKINREAVRNFFIKYQDRLLYGSDLYTDGKENSDDLRKKMHKKWLADWQYLVTDHLITVPEVKGKIKGLLLPRTIIDKVYKENAGKWYPGIY